MRSLKLARYIIIHPKANYGKSDSKHSPASLEAGRDMPSRH